MTLNDNNTKHSKDQPFCRVVIVHDFLTQWGGAERALEALCEMFPEAPIYTLLYDKEKMRGKFDDKIIKTSFLQKLPKWLRQNKKYLLPLMPVAPETFDLRDFDLVISSSGAWSKGIVTRLHTTHIAYLHSPMRFVWDWNEKYLQSINKKAGVFKRLLLNYLRLWDYQASQRPDILVANSKYTQERIQKYYRRDSEVVYPSTSSSVVSARHSSLGEEGYYLVVSRLSPYKKIDLVVEAFNKLKLSLIVIGEGEQKKYLQKIAGKTIKIIGWQDEEKLFSYYKNAEALIFPTVDDFGLTIVESLSCGTPVIAIHEGGAKEIVQAGVNGEFFEAQTIEVLADGVRRFMKNKKNYNSEVIKESAFKFSKEKFKKRIRNIINELA